MWLQDDEDSHMPFKMKQNQMPAHPCGCRSHERIHFVELMQIDTHTLGGGTPGFVGAYTARTLCLKPAQII